MVCALEWDFCFHNLSACLLFCELGLLLLLLCVCRLLLLAHGVGVVVLLLERLGVADL